jgi:hypothetical protein
MKRMIISPAQLKMINEEMSFQGEVDASSESEMQNLAENISNTQTGGTAIVANTAPTATQNGTGFYDPNVPIGQQNFKNFKNIAVATTNESRFSKRQVELGRMLEMRRTGKVFSKKQLNEMFMETQENADELRNIFKNGGGRNLAFKVAEIIDDVFPEESYGSELLDAVLGGADPAEFIIQNIFSDFADKEQEREVLDRIRELTTKRGF